LIIEYPYITASQTEPELKILPPKITVAKEQWRDGCGYFLSNMRKLAIVIVICTLLIPVVSSPPLADAYLSPDRAPKQIFFTSDMKVNLVVVGDEWDEKDREGISSRLIKSHAPMDLHDKSPVGVEYRYNYTFVSAGDLFSSRLYTFIQEATLEAAIPEPIEQWILARDPEVGEVEEVAYGIVNAFDIEEWIRDNWEFDDGYTIFFFLPHGEELNYLHTYGMLTTDPDTGEEFLQEGMLGFGGSYRFYFVDLTAGPWIYPEPNLCEVPDSSACAQVNPARNKNVYDIASAEELYGVISEYVNNAVTLLFTPSYVYSPSYRISHEISVIVIDVTADRSMVGPAQFLVNVDLINEAFRNLIPYAEWSSAITALTIDELSDDLQEAILSSVELHSINGSDTVIVNSAELIEGLGKWAVSVRPEGEVRQVSIEVETETFFIPVLILVFDTEAYVDAYGISGLAVSGPADPGIPCCTIVASGKDDLFLTGEGLSVLTIHETAHVLGLTHPHDGYRPDLGDFTDWFFDWSYTPLTYGAPSANGCGLAELCGMIVSDFGRLNFDAIDRGLVLGLLDETQLNVYDAMLLLDDLGYSYSDLPSEMSATLSTIDSDVVDAEKHFTDMNYFNHVTFRDRSSIMNPMDDAFDFALRASESSQQLLEDVQELRPLITGEERKLDITVTAKQKNNLIVMSVQNNDELPLYGVKISQEDGFIRFVGAKGFGRDRIDASNVLITTNYGPIAPGKSLQILLVSDNEDAPLHWYVLSKAGNEIANGVTSQKP
jgi:hypothetical protein